MHIWDVKVDQVLRQVLLHLLVEMLGNRHLIGTIRGDGIRGGDTDLIHHPGKAERKVKKIGHNGSLILIWNRNNEDSKFLLAHYLRHVHLLP